MRKKITSHQKSAILIGQQLGEKITTNAQLADIFLQKIKALPEEKKYADVIREVLAGEDVITRLSHKTLRSIAQRALKELLTQEEYQSMTKKAQQRGGKKSVKNIQQKKNIQAMSDKEKEFLNSIISNPYGYKKNTVRDIKKIQKELKRITTQERKRSTIKSYLMQYNTDKKETISRQDHPEEIKTLKQLYEKHYEPGKKLPSKKIAEALNAIHHHQRNENAVENYIRTHRKTKEQKQAMTADVRSDEEKEFIRNIISKKDEYLVKEGRGMGGYNLSKILAEYQQIFPEGTRNKKGIKHQLFKQENILKKEMIHEGTTKQEIPIF